MKRELCAAALLLLLIGGAVWNLHLADRLTDRVSDSLGRAEQAARREDYDSAIRELENALTIWGEEQTYTQMFFRQPDLDGLQDAFSALGQLLWQKDEAWPAALDLLRYHLDMVDRMEHLSLGTIF